jgi:hypothetical protein
MVREHTAVRKIIFRPAAISWFAVHRKVRRLSQLLEASFRRAHFSGSHYVAVALAARDCGPVSLGSFRRHDIASRRGNGIPGPHHVEEDSNAAAIVQMFKHAELLAERTARQTHFLAQGQGVAKSRRLMG